MCCHALKFFYTTFTKISTPLGINAWFSSWIDEFGGKPGSLFLMALNETEAAVVNNRNTIKRRVFVLLIGLINLWTELEWISNELNRAICFMR